MEDPVKAEVVLRLPEAMLGGSSGSASRAAIKKALLAIQLTRRAGEHEQRRDSREERPEELQRSRSGAGPTLPAIKAGRRMLHPRPEAGAAGVDASALPSNTEGGIFRGSSVGEKMRKRDRLKRGVSQGAARSSHSMETPADDSSDSSGSDSPQSEVKSSKSTPGSGGLSQGVQLIMDQLEMQRSQAGPPGISPFGSGLAAMKVKHRLQALHQEAKKKPQPESKMATSGLSVGNVVATEKAHEIAETQAQENLQQAAMAAVNAAINAARTTLPNFSSTPDEAEEAEITAMLGEADSELLDLVKEVQRILRWLFADGDVDFDGQLTHQELKAIFQRAPQPLGASLGMEVDISTAHTDKNVRYSRNRFIELVILVCVRVNQSPILSSRLAEVKRFVRRGSSTGRTLDVSSSSEQLAAPQTPQMKVSLLSAVPRLESTPAPGGSKWTFARSAVHDMSERRMSQEDLNPLKKLESLFASVKKS